MMRKVLIVFIIMIIPTILIGQSICNNKIGDTYDDNRNGYVYDGECTIANIKGKYKTADNGTGILSFIRFEANKVTTDEQQFISDYIKKEYSIENYDIHFGDCSDIYLVKQKEDIVISIMINKDKYSDFGDIEVYIYDKTVFNNLEYHKF
jgi:hypothetical protein